MIHEDNIAVAAARNPAAERSGPQPLQTATIQQRIKHVDESDSRYTSSASVDESAGHLHHVQANEQHVARSGCGDDL